MYRLTFLLCVLQFLSNAKTRELPNNYTKGTDGSHYKYIGEEAKWIDASKVCNEDGAHLAIDDSQIVHDYLVNTYPSLQYWIGINELAGEGTWRYNDGRKVLKSYWDSKQPGNDKKNDDCVAMGESGKWHDDACTLQKPFLCQIKEIPDDYTEGLDGNYYKYFSNKTNWHDANSRCNEDGALLAIVQSDDILKFLIKTYPSLKYWIGVNDIAAKGTWLLADGTRIKKEYWESGQPKDVGHCVTMWDSGRWRVDDCAATKSFLCQFSVSGHHLNELMDKKFQNNGFTAPVIMGIVVLIIFLCLIWCIFKHRKSRSRVPKAAVNKAKRPSTQGVTSNPQPRFVINLNDTITINPIVGSKSISTIQKSVVFASTSDTTIHHYPVYNPAEAITLPRQFDNHGFVNNEEYLPSPSYYTLAG